MPMPPPSAPHPLTPGQARRIWLRAQRLDAPDPFGIPSGIPATGQAGGDGAAATRAAVEHLGYVQIDTINVIERCHHHILYTRIPAYRRDDLRQAQSRDKSVFEYWTHALAYVPTRDYRHYLADMAREKLSPKRWFQTVVPDDLRRVLSLIRHAGPLTIRDITDDVLVEKAHPWASRKPSKRALQLAFYTGALTVSERTGMLKTYELTDRHFGWTRRPRPSPEGQTLRYLLDRALRSQGIVSLDSICHLDAARKPAIRALIEGEVRRRRLVPVRLDGADRIEHWARPETLEIPSAGPELVHLLSPFDPLVIQRKRLRIFFDYDHRFEAYLPANKRIFGYFSLPVLVGDEIVAAIDLKTDRANRRLLVRRWTWVGPGTPKRHAPLIEEALHRFERFQLES